MATTKSNPVLKAKVKGTDRIVDVYKLKNKKSSDNQAVYNIFLGDNLTMAAVEQKLHEEQFTEDQLQFI